MDFKNARPIGEPAGQYNPLQVDRNSVPQTSVLAQANVDGGMVTVVDPADIPDNAFVLLKNLCYVDGKRCETRKGTDLLTPAAPDTNKIQRFYDYKHNDGSHDFLRFTASTIHKRGFAWTPITGTALTGTDADRFRCITVFGRCFFTNNGADEIQEIDTTTNTYTPLGNAPRYKYITGFYNRIVGSFRRDSVDNPVELGWSAEAGVSGAGLEEWDPLVDETAGSSPLIESPNDFNDFLGPVFGFTNILVVLREQSVWLGTKQPIPTFPFNLYCAFPGIGCDCPDSARVTLNGVTWADSRTRMVWHYVPGAAPTPIGEEIQNILFSGALDPATVFSGYSSSTFEYTLGIPQANTNVVKLYRYNFRNKRWTQPEYDGVTAVDSLDLGPPTLTIGELTGTIAELTGTIGSLGRTGTPAPAMVLGRGDGELLEESNTLTTDPTYPEDGTTDDVVIEILSKAFTIPKDDVYVSEVRVKIIPLSDGSVTFRATKNDGDSFIAKQKTLDFNPADIGRAVTIKWTYTVSTERYAFDVLGVGKFRFLGYEVHINKAGDSRGYGVTP